MSLYKRDGIWWADISIPGLPRIRRSTHTASRKEAQRIHDEIKAQAWSNPAPTHALWSDAINTWTQAKPRSESELLSLAKFARYFPDRPMDTVKPQDLEKALAFCQSAATYLRYRAMLNAILKLSGSSVRVPSRKGPKAAPREWLTKEQWDALYRELPPHLRAPAKFAVATGLRQSNVFGLKWATIDLDRRHAYVEGHDTKAGKPIPIPLSDQAIEALEAAKGDDPVWCFTYRGKPQTSPKKAFRDAAIRAGVPTFTWHGLRHTWATWHVQKGTPLEVLRVLGGWSDLRMVLVYSHHTSEHLARYV